MTLSSWNSFNKLRQDEKWASAMPDGLTHLVNLFRARHDLASTLKTIEFEPEFSKDTTRAYLAGTRLLLSYSAGEALIKALRRFKGSKSLSVTNWALKAPELANQLRPLAQIAADRAEYYSLNDSTRKKLLHFSETQETDVRPIATTLRHIHAHGGLTARTMLQNDQDSTSAALSNGFVDAIEQLSELILKRCDLEFTKLTESISACMQNE